jgi:hypothetical protein
VDQQCPGLKLEEQVFRVAADGCDPLSRDCGRQARRYRPAQPALVDLERNNAPTPHVRLKASAGGFDFGKFGQARGSRAQGYLIFDSL